MARAAVRAKQAQQAQAQAATAKPRRRGHASGGNPNQDLFFSRIRRRQKWVFVFLALVFAISFAALGVGSGNGGGLEQMFNGILGNSGDPVATAQNEIKTNPAKGYQDLANAYVTKNDLPDAITAMNSYLSIKKTDANAWTLLGGYQEQEANTLAGEYSQILESEQLEAPSSIVKPTGALATAFGQNPIDQYYQQQLQQQATAPYNNAQNDYKAAAQAYETAAKNTHGRLEQAAAWYQVFQAASYAGEQAIELTALKHYVSFNPTGSNLKQIEATCKAIGGSCVPKHHGK